jgi:hypothetical protein
MQGALEPPPDFDIPGRREPRILQRSRSTRNPNLLYCETAGLEVVRLHPAFDEVKRRRGVPALGLRPVSAAGRSSAMANRAVSRAACLSVSRSAPVCRVRRAQ